MRVARYIPPVVASVLFVGCGDGKTAANTVTVDRPATTPEVTPARRSVLKRCDANIRVRRHTTTCAFASNAFYAYFVGGEASTIKAYSPQVRRRFRLDCEVTGGIVVCRTQHGGVVKFSQAAVRDYSQTQADAYAASHDVGPARPTGGTTAAPARPPPPAPKDNCDPSYTGACLDPNASDYDCQGGSGDGPEYTGPVRVVGDDHFDLDRDGDGSACE